MDPQGQPKPPDRVERASVAWALVLAFAFWCCGCFRAAETRFNVDCVVSTDIWFSTQKRAGLWFLPCCLSGVFAGDQRRER